jgi:hypothetical protein
LGNHKSSIPLGSRGGCLPHLGGKGKEYLEDSSPSSLGFVHSMLEFVGLYAIINVRFKHGDSFLFEYPTFWIHTNKLTTWHVVEIM